ncbi:hypothetical protein BV898_01076 [Hypsibius exemplaris]|uniref:Uncharacterized protein n=1 Tax=Hypsibius exemplaris TaxID=2072580 RepID=A0A1W0XD43_HYPEX|nr:hypothetical protein BV898_01076 [Hypsibius exemplaris]
MADGEQPIDTEALDSMAGGIPELQRRVSQPYDYSEKQLGEKTHIPTVEVVRTHAEGGKNSGCASDCKCDDSKEGNKQKEGGKPCGKANCKCVDCKCGDSCGCE